MVFSMGASAQETDLTQTPNTVGAGIYKSLEEQIGAGRGDILTPDSSLLSDCARSVSRDRARPAALSAQIHQAQGVGPRTDDGDGDVQSDSSIGAGLPTAVRRVTADRAARPAVGVTSSRDPTVATRRICSAWGCRRCWPTRSRTTCGRSATATLGAARGQSGTRAARSKGIDYGWLTARADGSIRRRSRGWTRSSGQPFFAQGSAFSIREFVVGALNNEMGLGSGRCRSAAANKAGGWSRPAAWCSTARSNISRDRRLRDRDEDGDDDGVVDEVDPALVDYLEFYLLNYFRPGRYEPYPSASRKGRRDFEEIGCTSCHMPDLELERDRRVADVETDVRPGAGRLQRPVRHGAHRFETVADDRLASAAEPGAGAALSWCGTSSPTSSATTSARTSTSATTTARFSASSSPSRSGASRRRHPTGTTVAASTCGGYPPARRRGAAIPRRFRRPVGGATAPGARVSRLARAVSAGRYRVQSRWDRGDRTFRSSATAASRSGAVQRPGGRGVSGCVPGGASGACFTRRPATRGLSMDDCLALS